MIGSLSGSLGRIGQVALFQLQLLKACGPALLRPRLVVHQVYICGARSLVIIML